MLVVRAGLTGPATAPMAIAASSGGQALMPATSVGRHYTSAVEGRGDHPGRLAPQEGSPVRRRDPLPRLAALAMAVSVVSGLAALPARAADSPAGAVDAVLDAIVAGEPGSLDPLVCAQRRGGVDVVLDLAGALGGGVVDVGALLDGATVALDDRSVMVVAETADAASVAIDGQLRITVDPTVARAWLRAGLEAAGQPAPDAVVDWYLEGLLTILEDGIPMATAVHVVREGSEWLLCDVIRTGLAFNPDVTPTPITGALCDLMTVDELNAATGFAFLTATPFQRGCQWDAEVASGYHTVSLRTEQGELDEITAVWMRGRELTVAGRPAWATSSGTWVDLGDGLLAILPQLDGATVAGSMDAITFGRTVAELVVPRLP